MTRKWEWYKKNVGWWCFGTSGKVGSATIMDANDSMLNAIEKVGNALQNFFIPTKIEVVTYRAEEIITVQNNNEGFAFSDIKQIIINEISRLNSLGKEVSITKVNLHAGKTNVFVYADKKIIEEWLFPEGLLNIYNLPGSIISMLFINKIGNSAPCIHLSIHSDIFLRKTLNGEDNTELGELNNKKLEKVLKGFREAFPDAEIDYESEYLKKEYLYECGFKR